MTELVERIVTTLLLSLRVAPVFAFAPPFTLIRVPALVRVLLSIGLSAWLVSGVATVPLTRGAVLIGAAGELLLGITLALALQLSFAALLTAGRAIDIQAGFGLAALIDPTTRAQLPLVGTIFAYASGAIFFATDGPGDLLAIWAASVERMPVGSATFAPDPTALFAYISAVFFIAFGLGGTVMLALFLADVAIAFMSRTLPQMNVLLLGFQVKALIMLALLPLAITLGSGVFLRLLRIALETAPRLI